MIVCNAQHDCQVRTKTLMLLFILKVVQYSCICQASTSYSNAANVTLCHQNHLSVSNELSQKKNNNNNHPAFNI